MAALQCMGPLCAAHQARLAANPLIAGMAAPRRRLTLARRFPDFDAPTLQLLTVRPAAGSPLARCLCPSCSAWRAHAAVIQQPRTAPHHSNLLRFLGAGSRSREQRAKKAPAAGSQLTTRGLNGGRAPCRRACRWTRTSGRPASSCCSCRTLPAHPPGSPPSSTATRCAQLDVALLQTCGLSENGHQIGINYQRCLTCPYSQMCY